jgi:hypothetical protein
MTLDDAANKVRVPGHKGPHPEAYHHEVNRRLVEATEGLSGKPYQDALKTGLQQLRADILTDGSQMNRWVTGR